MEEIDLESWEEFEEKLKELDVNRNRQEEINTPIYVSPYLFRGQACSKWELKTTFERFYNEPIFLEGYYKIILSLAPHIEAATGKRFEIRSVSEYMDWIINGGLLNYSSQVSDFPASHYFAHLRHYGFPSPLLDWTRSPYIAAFFAFREIPENAEKVSVFAYIEQIGRGKGYDFTKPFIITLGPNVHSTERHSLQESVYTICIKKEKGEWYYAFHEEVFIENNRNQDILLKFNIPTTEKKKVLKHLDSYNLNSFTLFGTEESLMEKLATDIFIENLS